MSAQAAGGIILCFGNPEECQNCGGWTGAEGGPFPGDSRYCSEDCYADAQARAATLAARQASCGECGYDQAEHRPGCSLIPEGYCPGGGQAPAAGQCPVCAASWLAGSLDGIVPAHRGRA